jgi:hypothetical protein
VSRRFNALRFRLGTLLFTITVTAAALASGRLLSRYHDRNEFVALVVLWAASGFAIGFSFSAFDLNQRWRWLLAACACIAMWLFYFFTGFALDSLREPQIEATFPSILEILLDLHELHITLLASTAITAVILYAAQTSRTRLQIAATGLALFMWFLISWIGFLGSAITVWNDWAC